MIAQLPTYSLIGCASAIAGYSRYTFSVAIFMMECAQNYNSIIPSLVGVIVAKFVGDFLIKDHDWYSFFLGDVPFIHIR